MKLTKKGNLNILVPMVLLLVVAVIATSLCAGVITNIRDTQLKSTTYIQNETTLVTSGYQNITLTYAGPRSITSVINRSNAVTLTSGYHYITTFVTSHDILMINATSTFGLNASTISINYVADKYNEDYNASVSGLNGIANVSSQFASIGLVVGILVILGLLVSITMAYRNG